MFAMLSGPWSRRSDLAAVPGRDGGRAVDELVADAVRAQVAAGMDLVTDGLVRWPDPAAALRAAIERGETGDDGMLVRAWRHTAALPAAAGVTVAAVITGPCTLAAAIGTGDAGVAANYGDALAGELAALEAAGCELVVVDEPAAIDVGADPARRTAYRDAHRALLAGTPSLHAMLAIRGGSAWEAGAETVLDAPYHSYLVDLIAGPDNWYLVRAAPGDRGIVCAALRAPAHEDQAPLLVWAARYAASANGRGLARVGLSNASPLDSLDATTASRALADLARAARLAGLEPDAAVEAGLDPRTYSRGHARGARRGGLPPDIPPHT